MMYPLLTLDDGTEIVHSEKLHNDIVKVYVEKPDAKDCFHSFECYLPTYEIKNVKGFTEEEVDKYMKVVKSALGQSCITINT